MIDRMDRAFYPPTTLTLGPPLRPSSLQCFSVLERTQRAVTILRELASRGSHRESFHRCFRCRRKPEPAVVERGNRIAPSRGAEPSDQLVTARRYMYLGTPRYGHLGKIEGGWLGRLHAIPLARTSTPG